MSMLTDRRLGATSEWMRGRVGKSAVRETRAAARRVGRLERTLAFDLPIPQGLEVGDRQVLFDDRGFVRLWSPLDTIDMTKEPYERHHQIGMDVADGAAGCDCCLEDATFSVILNPGHPIALLFNPATCTLVLNLPCDPCGEGVDPG